MIKKAKETGMIKIEKIGRINYGFYRLDPKHHADAIEAHGLQAEPQEQLYVLHEGNGLGKPFRRIAVLNFGVLPNTISYNPNLKTLRQTKSAMLDFIADFGIKAATEDEKVFAFAKLLNFIDQAEEYYADAIGNSTSVAMYGVPIIDGRVGDQLVEIGVMYGDSGLRPKSIPKKKQDDFVRHQLANCPGAVYFAIYQKRAYVKDVHLIDTTKRITG